MSETILVSDEAVLTGRYNGITVFPLKTHYIIYVYVSIVAGPSLPCSRVGL